MYIRDVLADAHANLVALAVGLIGLGVAALLSRRLRLTLLDLVRPGTIHPEDLKSDEGMTPGITVMSGGIVLERDKPKTYGITGSTPALGTPSG
jgi:hypothetical protein